jgi:hypothetical protein
MKIDGRCACGYITVEGEADPDNVSICHCTDCQTGTGAAFRVSVLVPGTSFRMTGEPTRYLKTTADSGTPRIQAFCPRCGSPIYSAPPTDGPRLLFLRVGTINQRDQFVPKLQLWARSQQPWVDELEGVRKVAKQEIPGLATQK